MTSGSSLPCTLPDVAAHADWSVSPGKRWLAIAARAGHSYELLSVEPFGRIVERLESWRDRRVLLGVDFPIGVPAAFADALGIDAFLPWVRGLDDAAFAALSDVAASPDEISRARPFYPSRPGGAVVQHLLDGLGFATRLELLRGCDRSPPLARPAAPLFWTLGAQQVGKGALAGWAEVVRAPGVRVWPFDGLLEPLLASAGTIVAETYPGQAARDLGAGFGPVESKRRQDDRRARGPMLLERADELGVQVAPALAADVVEGFGPATTGEDRFDAFVGLLQVIRVIRGERPPDPPTSEWRARSVEGWMLGIG